GRCQFCPTGWLWDAGHCYYFSAAKKTWEQSREDCCSRRAQLVTIRANTTLVSAPCLVSPSLRVHWATFVTTPRLFPIQRSTTFSPACGRLSGSGLSGGWCGEHLGWICEQNAATVQWLRSSSPAFLWGNTTYTCVGP
ncbi:KLRG1 protein, partial [Pedionomus torquatus]|nr:KLRG1 protein [Pedionomus torquatus]